MEYLHACAWHGAGVLEGKAIKIYEASLLIDQLYVDVTV